MPRSIAVASWTSPDAPDTPDATPTDDAPSLRTRTSVTHQTHLYRVGRTFEG